jgi:hypothetical protein
MNRPYRGACNKRQVVNLTAHGNFHVNIPLPFSFSSFLNIGQSLVTKQPNWLQDVSCVFKSGKDRELFFLFCLTKKSICEINALGKLCK